MSASHSNLSPPDTAAVISISVRELVEFVLRSGDLGGSSHFAGPNRALEGTRGHQRLQKSRPAAYQAEVAVQHRVETPTIVLEISGRIDGLLLRNGTLLVEEIKTHYGPWAGPADPLHFAQARFYAAVYAAQNGFPEAEIQVTYFDLNSETTTCFRETHAESSLREFLDRTVSEYVGWLEDWLAWKALRDHSIRALQFPYGAYRPGQREFAVAVYKSIQAGCNLFAEAPTGIGKTISVVFPALKALAELKTERLFYLTAKTIGRTVAQKALADLRAHGLRLRSVSLTAKDKICFNNGQPCDTATCAYALGYYDRIRPALKEALASECLDRTATQELAKKYTVCPFELSLDAALWADLILCDYNYAFDPSASLKRFFDSGKHHYAMLVDEAHNLPERAREMFSADLTVPELVACKSAIAQALPECARALEQLRANLALDPSVPGVSTTREALVSLDPPRSIAPLLQRFSAQAESWLTQNQPADFKQVLLESYFRVLAFQRTLDTFDHRYVTTWNPGTQTLRLFCLDPSATLAETLKRNGSAVFFSATLRPLDYFQQSLGAAPSDSARAFPSPFPPENLRLHVYSSISTRFRSRSSTYGAVADAIRGLIREKPGNYLAFFPSYEYLRLVQEHLERSSPPGRLIVQRAGMSESDRESFLAEFRDQSSQTLLGLAVLGGVFGEGIDLLGDRLIGLAIVGPGLPQICLERELIREYFNRAEKPGFDYAYTFPGMNRVLQAAGRLIRSESDRGTLVLIDDRFKTPMYRRLMPAWWQPRFHATPGPDALKPALAPQSSPP